ncbi:Glycosyl transferase, family 17 [Artemisia annua]|uniref:Glycosyl transferase, family 17 n=1 Tax=Artemisia annua TaxID=35608 RepID=A0A2U1MTL5_ARTAN|nr:Glycosyl transferase, family 17 [Artemisia annua]
MGFIIMNLNKLMDRIYLMAEEGGSRYCSKKSDDICGDICDDQLFKFILQGIMESWILTCLSFWLNQM